MAGNLTPVQAHRKRCLNCLVGSYRVVRQCQETGCESHPFRLGKNPNRTGIGGKASRRSQGIPENR
jgi:hypothetical protein